ncbi:MAG TPA: ABC transporter permease [Elusimicrobiota bacterium]|nr:ABC transporter permease [Elusimicrobiota bacterium]
MTPFHLARREIRHRPLHAALFVLSVALGSGVLLGLSGFNAAVETGVQRQARELWAADITVEGTPGFLDDLEVWATGRWPGLRSARTVDTVSMLRAADGEGVTRATLSGLSPGYPLYGTIGTGSGRSLTDALTAGAVASPKILAQLNLAVGDELVLGRRRVPIADTLAARTDAPASFFEFAPSLLLPLDTLEDSGLLGPGSRSLNKLYLNLPPGVALEPVLEEVKKRAAAETTDVKSWATDNPGVLRFIQNTLTYLNFLGLFLLALAGIGVASALQSAIAASLRSLGMMRALGAPRGFLFRLWGAWIALLLTGGLGGGLALGRLVSFLLARLFGDMIPVSVSLGFPGTALLQTTGLAAAAIGLFALLPLWRLTEISPNSILAWDLPQILPSPRKALMAGIAFAPLFYGLVVLQVRRPGLALEYLLAIAGLILGAALLVAFLSGLLRRALRLSRALTPRLTLRSLARPGSFQTAAGVSLALSFAAVLTLALTQKNLTSQLVESFPENMPNVFFINVQDAQIPRFREIVKTDFRLFPLVRGRVVSVNGVPVRDLNARAQQRGDEGDSFTREFGLTYGPDLLPTDTVVAGGALWNDRIDGPQVSGFIEHRRRFGLNVGDRLEFSVLGRRLSATVSSLRSIDQKVRQPFFYFYFKPGPLDRVPHTFMGGVHLDPTRLLKVEKQLTRELPNVTTIDVTAIARLTGKILARLARVVNALGLFTFAAGLLLLTSSLLAGLADRQREAVLYRTLGGTLSQILRVFLLEHLLRGAAASLTALVVGTVAAWVLIHRVMDLPFGVPWGSVFLGLSAATLFLGAFSLALSVRALRTAPMEVLRYE